MSGTRRTAARPAFEIVFSLPLPPPGRDPPVGLDLILNPDGTTTAWNPGKTKVLHSHSHLPEPGNTRPDREPKNITQVRRPGGPGTRHTATRPDPPQGSTG